MLVRFFQHLRGGRCKVCKTIERGTAPLPTLPRKRGRVKRGAVLRRLRMRVKECVSLPRLRGRVREGASVMRCAAAIVAALTLCATSTHAADNYPSRRIRLGGRFGGGGGRGC